MGRPAEICNWSPVQRKWQRFQLRAHYDGCQLWSHHNPDSIHTGAEVWQYSPAILSLTIGVTTHISTHWSKSLSFCTNTASYLINSSLYRSPQRTICAHPTPSILFCEKNNIPLKTCHLFISSPNTKFLSPVSFSVVWQLHIEHPFPQYIYYPSSEHA